MSQGSGLMALAQKFWFKGSKALVQRLGIEGFGSKASARKLWLEGFGLKARPSKAFKNCASTLLF